MVWVNGWGMDGSQEEREAWKGMDEPVVICRVGNPGLGTAYANC